MVFETGHLVAMSNHLGRAETVGATTCNDLQRPRVAAFFHSAHDQAPQVLQGSSSKMRAEKCSRDYRFQEHLTTRRNMESTYLMCIATLQSFAKIIIYILLIGWSCKNWSFVFTHPISKSSSSISTQWLRPSTSEKFSTVHRFEAVASQTKGT